MQTVGSVKSHTTRTASVAARSGGAAAEQVAGLATSTAAGAASPWRSGGPLDELGVVTAPAGRGRRRRCPPCRPAGGRRATAPPRAIGRWVRPMPVADHDVTSRRQRLRRRRRGPAACPACRPARPVTKSTCTLPPKGRPQVSSSRRRARDVAEVEQLELGHDLALLGLLVELDHERPGVEEDVVAEVRRAAGERARVGRRRRGR